uniref:Uncharacterized protein n=1 Tax=Pipistrellus kuhlii TaxID=59472 RepID=A0A7J8B1W8_PIPKU|nr:hypothetical protein mPipKuh1_007718 [Pipistrellus kuhlii]
MNETWGWCTLVDVYLEQQTTGGRKTYAMVSGHSPNHSLASELVESNDGHEEIIKVFLKGRFGDKMIHEKNINQLKSDVQYIQEARNCLQKLQEDISSKLIRDPGESHHRQEIQVVLERPNGFSPSPTATLYSSPAEVAIYMNEDVKSLRKTVRDLLAKLQEAEQQPQADHVAFEVTLQMIPERSRAESWGPPEIRGQSRAERGGNQRAAEALAPDGDRASGLTGEGQGRGGSPGGTSEQEC